MPEPDETIPEEWIRDRSYRIWELEFRPQGRHMEHWFRAKAELRSEQFQAMRRGEILVGQGSIYFWDHCG